MLRIFTCFVLLLLHGVAVAQQVQGKVIDKQSRQGIVGVNIINKRTGAIISSGGQGSYSIDAMSGDTLLFRHMSYITVRETVYNLGDTYRTIVMESAPHTLKEATVSRTKYQQDSIERHETYGHELSKELVPKPKFYGLACAGCVGWLVDKITGNSKQPKRFRKTFATEDEIKFIDSRYTIELVAPLVGLRDTDSIVTFINTYPMEYSFARASTPLELKAWIRNNYKEYIHQVAVKKD